MKNWLQAMALIASAAGLTLALGGHSRPQVVDLVGVPWELSGPDLAPLLFGLALMAWAVLTFVAASAGRRPALAVSMGTVIALGLWAVRLAGPFWFDLASVTVAVGLAGACLPAAVLLIAPTVRRAH